MWLLLSQLIHLTPERCLFIQYLICFFCDGGVILPAHQEELATFLSIQVLSTEFTLHFYFTKNIPVIEKL